MRLLTACTCLLLTLAPAASAAPMLEPLKPCYVSVTTGPGTFETEPVDVKGAGFGPGETVNVAIDGVDIPTGGVPADANGAISGTVAAPGIEDGERIFTVSATQASDLTQTDAVTAKVTNLTARLKPRKASPRRKVRFIGQGFTDPDAPIYAHYVRGTGSKVRKTVKLVNAPTGDCGTFSVRRKQFPFQPKGGDWTVRINQGTRFDADLAAVNISVRVRRVKQ